MSLFMSLLEKLCAELGVELEENWIGNDGLEYRIASNGKLQRVVYSDFFGCNSYYDDKIERLLTGELKLKWEPKHGEFFFIPKFDIFNNSRYEKMRFERGNKMHEWLVDNELVFETPLEANRATNQIVKSNKMVLNLDKNFYKKPDNEDESDTYKTI